jgi:hypothetical protein
LPGGTQLVRHGRGQLQQAVVELLLGLGQGGQPGDGVDAEEEGAGLVVAHVQDLHVHFHVAVEVAAEVAVEELEPAVSS